MSTMRKWEGVTTEAVLTSLLPDGSGLCHAITKHISLTKFTLLGTSVDPAGGAALLPLHSGCAAEVLVKISPGSHQSLSSTKQGGFLVHTERDMRDGEGHSPKRYPRLSSQLLLSAASEVSGAGGILCHNLKYRFCWPHS